MSPIVSTYGTPKVALQPLPQVRKQAAETPTSEGAGLDDAIAQKDETAGAAIGAPIERVGLELSQKIQERAVAQVNQTQKLAFFNGLSDWKAGALYDPEKGAFAQQGINALTLPEQVKSSFDAKVADLMLGMKTPEQKASALSIAADEWRQVSDDVQRHVDNEVQHYHNDQLNATVTNAANAALQHAQDPPVVKQNLDIATGALTAYGQLHGESPELTAAKVAAAQSGVHVGVIRNLLAAGLETQANDYFATVGPKGANQIAGDQLDETQKALEIGTVRAQAQQVSDRIIGEGGTLSQQLEKTKALEPKLRDDVTQRLKQQFDVDQEMARQTEGKNLADALNTLYADPQHRVSSIAPTTLASIPTHREMLDREAERLTRGEPARTDPVTYYALKMKAADDPVAFAKENLAAYWDRLDASDRKGLVDLQAAIVTGQREQAEKILAPARVQQRVVDDALVSYGINPTAKATTPEGKAIAQLRDLVRTRVQAQEDLSGKPVTDPDVTKIAAQILTTSRTVPGSWWAIFPGTSGHVGDRTYRLTDIPTIDRMQIEAALKAKGRPVNDDNVLAVYAASQR